MTLFLFKHLRCNIVRRPTDSPPLLIIELKFGGKSEIARLDLHLLGEEEVSQLEITVDHPVLVHVLDCLQDLLSVALHFQFGKSLTPLDLLVQSRVTAQLHYDVHILVVFKEVLELDNIRVVHSSVDFDLALQLLFGSLFCQGGLGDDFDSLSVVQFHITDLVHFCETTFP